MLPIKLALRLHNYYKIELPEAIMKKRILAIIITAAAIGLAGCDPNINDHYDGHDGGYYDTTPPNPPANVSVLALDNEVELTWSKSSSPDVAGYNVYYSYEYLGKYTLLGHTTNNYYIDGGANGPQNGVKYYYAVDAYDYDGNVSELSGTNAFGIPRPEGYNVPLFDFNINAAKGGYDFSTYAVVDYTDLNSDLFFEKYNGKFYLDVWEDGDIKDMGATYDITSITLAPVSGYVEIVPGDNIKYAVAVEGHTYVIRTWDNHFAKVRVKQIAADRIIFDWAYQLVENERMLKEGAKTTRTRTFDAVKVHR